MRATDNMADHERGGARPLWQLIAIALCGLALSMIGPNALSAAGLSSPVGDDSPVGNDSPPTETSLVRLHVDVLNDNGGTLEPNSLGMRFAGATHFHQQVVELFPGPQRIWPQYRQNYELVSINCADTESGLPLAVTIVNFGRSGDFDLPGGGDFTCIITVDDLPSSVAIDVYVLNNDEGTATSEDISFTFSGERYSGFTGFGDDRVTIDPGEHSFVVDPIDGYVLRDRSCFDVRTNTVLPIVDDLINVVFGVDVYCNLSLDDVGPPPLMTLRSTVNGVDELPVPGGRFTVDGVEVAEGQPVEITVGPHTLTASADTEYQVGGVLCFGENHRSQGLSFETMNDGDIECLVDFDGPTRSISMWAQIGYANGGLYNINAQPLFQIDSRDPLGDAVQVFDGEHTLVVNDYFGIQASSVTCVDTEGNNAQATSGVIVVDGSDVICQVRYEAQSLPKLSAYHVVVNNDGGTVQPSQFALYVDGRTYEHRQTESVQPGVKPIESFRSGYRSRIARCLDVTTGTDLYDAGSETIELRPDADVRCTVVHTDDPTRILLQGLVINNDGGTATPDDISIAIDGEAVTRNSWNNLPRSGAMIEVAALPLDGYATREFRCYDRDSRAIVSGYFTVEFRPDGALIRVDSARSIVCTVLYNDRPTAIRLLPVVRDHSGTRISDPADLELVVGDMSVDARERVFINPGPASIGVSAAGFDVRELSCTDGVGGEAITVNGGEISAPLGSNIRCVIQLRPESS